MPKIYSREIRLVSRPKGIPTAANFILAQVELEPLQDQQVLIRNLFISVDPYMRGRMNDGKSYVPAFELGKPLEGGAVGEVIESRAKGFKPGDTVTSNFGWREYFNASPKDLHPTDRTVQPLSIYLGALGMTGNLYKTNLINHAATIIFPGGETKLFSRCIDPLTIADLRTLRRDRKRRC